jgi:Na+/proline symporter
VFAQIMFFGALLSAIKSCASATLLAPSVSFSENILKPFFKDMGDQQFLKLMRIVLVGFTCMVTFFALNSDASIYKMVENAYKVTLVGAFVPLVCGLYWKRATNLGGVLSVTLGPASWIRLRVLLRGRHGAPAVGRPHGELRRHGRGLARVAQPAARGDHLICWSPS